MRSRIKASPEARSSSQRGWKNAHAQNSAEHLLGQLRLFLAIRLEPATRKTSLHHVTSADGIRIAYAPSVYLRGDLN